MMTEAQYYLKVLCSDDRPETPQEIFDKMTKYAPELGVDNSTLFLFSDHSILAIDKGNYTAKAAGINHLWATLLKLSLHKP